MGNGVLSALRNVTALRTAALAFSLLFVASCELSSPAGKIVEGEIEGKKYYVPIEYFAPPFKTIGENTLYVYALYPDFVPGSWGERKKYDPRKIYVMAFPKGIDQSFNTFAKKGLAHPHGARKFFAQEYELQHYRQENESLQHLDDLWIEKENDKITSYIQCSEKQSETSVPHCSDKFFRKGFFYKIRFNKNLLPHWREIRNNVKAMLDSFENLDTAKQFYLEHTQSYEQEN